MKASDFYQRCKNLAGDTSDREWNKYSLAGFLQEFRETYDPLQLKALMLEMPLGHEVFERILMIFEAMNKRDAEDDRASNVFGIDEVKAIKSWGIQLLESYRGMALELGEEDLVDTLTPIPTMQVCYEAAPELDPTNYETLDVYVYEIQSDWHRDY